MRISKINFLRFTATALAMVLAYETAAIPLAQASTIGQPTNLSSIQTQQRASSSSIASHQISSNRFNIPESVGSVVDVYAPSRSSRLVYHLQDIHNNVAAQTNISQIVTMLDAHAAKQGKTLLVAVEGMSGSSNWEKITRDSDQKTKEDVAAALLRAGYMLGEEYAIMTSRPGRMQIVGIETPELYQQNRTSRSDSKAARQNTLSVVRQTREQLRRLAPHNFNELLTSLEKKRIAAEEGTLPLGEYVQFLHSVNSAVIAQHPNLARLAQLTKEEAGINFEKVEKEGKQLVQEVMASKSEKEMDRVLADAQALKEGRLSPLSYYSSLLSQSNRDFPEVRRYVSYLRSSETINSDQLFDETLQAEAEIAVKMIKHPLARQLFDHIRWIELQERFFSLNMIPQEWAVQRNYSSEAIATHHDQIRAFVAEQVADLGYKFTTPALAKKDLDVAYAGAYGFYDAATKRDTAMMENLLKIISSVSADKTMVVFIAGGFHTPGMTKLLRSNGLAYEVIRPQIETNVELSQAITVAPRRVNYVRDPGVGDEAAAAALAAAKAGQPELIKPIADQATGGDQNPPADSDKPANEGNKEGKKTVGDVLDDLAKKLKDKPLDIGASIMFLPALVMAFIAIIGILMAKMVPGSGSAAGGSRDHLGPAVTKALAADGSNTDDFQTKLAATVDGLQDSTVQNQTVIAVDVDGFTGEDGAGFVGLFAALNARASMISQPNSSTVLFSRSGQSQEVMASVGKAVEKYFASKYQVAGVKIYTTAESGNNIREVLQSVNELNGNLPSGSVFVIGNEEYKGENVIAVPAANPVEGAVRAFALGRYGKDNAEAATRRFMDLLLKHFTELEKGHFSTETLIQSVTAAIIMV